MADSKSVLVFKGEFGDTGKTVITGVEDVAALDTLATGLIALTDAGLVVQSFSVRDVNDATPIAGSNTDRRGVAYFQDVESGAVTRITIPAIKLALCEHIKGKNEGERLKSTTMTTIQNLLEAATGKDLRPLEGVVLQKK